MLFVITGNGKGKTTSSLGMVSRSLGQGLRCSVIQFLKSNPKVLGEYRTFTGLGVDWENWGQGFLWDQKTLEPTKELCRRGWESFKEKACGGEYGMIVLDEFTYVLSYGLLDKGDVLSFLETHIRTEGFPHIVITGRNAPQELIDMADTVSEVNEVKHHFRTNGGRTVKGIEF